MKTQDTIRMRESIPLSALLPGLGGLIPFWLLALSVVLPIGIPPVIALVAFITYGAVILSFVGAIWWGLAAASPDSPDNPDSPRAMMFLWSVTPALIGWLATLVAADLGVLILAAGFLLQWAFDAVLINRAPRFIPPWVFRLRTLLTAGVLLAITAAWWLLV
jgi:hypothetical protein